MPARANAIVRIEQSRILLNPSRRTRCDEYRETRGVRAQPRENEGAARTSVVHRYTERSFRTTPIMNRATEVLHLHSDAETSRDAVHGSAGEELLTVRDAARLLNVTVSWVYEHTRDDAEDRLPFVKLGKYVLRPRGWRVVAHAPVMPEQRDLYKSEPSKIAIREWPCEARTR